MIRRCNLNNSSPNGLLSIDFTEYLPFKFYKIYVLEGLAKVKESAAIGLE